MADENSNGLGMGMGILIGLVLLMVILAVFYFLGRPGGTAPTPAPQAAPTTGDNIIEVPDQIDVNVDDANPAE